MKGVIFNIVQEIVEELYDHETWDDLLEYAELEGAYTSLGDYADGQLHAIVAAAVSITGMGADELLREIGRHALPKLVERIPPTLVLPPDPRSFIHGVNDIIHPEVLKLYPSSRPPVFEVADLDDGLIVHYSSSRKLPDLAHGLLSGVDAMFPHSTTVERLPDDEERACFRVCISSP